MPRFIISIACVLVLFVAGSAQALPIIVNINAVNDAANSPQTLYLAAGTYQITPISTADGGAYTAWSAHLGQANTWVHRYSYSSPEIGQVDIGGTGSGPYSVDEAAAYATALPSSFTLTSAANVAFFVCDGPGCYSYAYDNRGGVSLQIVPEPASASLLSVATVVLGTASLRRRVRRCRSHSASA